MADGDIAAAVAAWTPTLAADDLKLGYGKINQAADLAFKYGTLSFANATALLAYTSGVATYQQAVDRGTGDVYRWSGTVWQLWSTGWKSYTPTLGGVTVGNGTLTGSYRYVDGTLHILVQFTLGSTSAITGDLTATTPVTLNNRLPLIGTGDASIGSTTYTLYLNASSTTTLRARYQAVSGSGLAAGTVSATLPATWVSGSGFTLQAIARAY